MLRESLASLADPTISLGTMTDQFMLNAQRNQAALLREGQLAGDTLGLVNQLTGQFSGAMAPVQQSLTLGMKDFTNVLGTPGETAKTAKETQDEFTNSVTRGVVALNQLAIDIDKMMTQAMIRFADDVPEILEGFRKKLVQLGLLDGETAPRSAPPVPEISNAEASAIIERGGVNPRDITQEMIESQKARSRIEEQNRQRNARRAARVNQNQPTEENAPEILDIQGMAVGGIIGARNKGTLVRAAEAGFNEAFVPLPDGKSIPVSLNVELTQLLKDNNVVITNVSKDMRDAIQTMLLNSGVTDTTSQDQLVSLMTQFLEAQREAKREMEDQTQALRRLYDAYA
jgi:hypothetical protein